MESKKRANVTFLSAILVLGAVVVGCAAQTRNLRITTDSIVPGSGHQVAFRDGQLELEGRAVRTGDPAPSAVLTGTDLQPVELASLRGRVKIVSVVPSLDTPVCEEQTHYLSEKNEGLDQSVDLITISMDLPFAQKRFAKSAKIGNVLFLSDHRAAEFGKAYGLLIPELRLLSRAVLVLDDQNVIRHLQVVPDLGVLPDMEAAFSTARRLLAGAS